ncbi:MAG: prepilin-type N-terminal cleavage/methylation domain-containing protein [Actinomycetota bacterium]|nr:prepilin-type N-terminal cleavage/methylation domain-containing protein [Actinomycetota bacterium]
MKRLYNYLHQDERGFTLVELLIVVIILAVLSGIAVPSYMALRNRARESATETEMKNIATALELYQADNEEYPDSATIAELAMIWQNYMANMPTTDAWDVAYVYALRRYHGYTLTSSWSKMGEAAEMI